MARHAAIINHMVEHSLDQTFHALADGSRRAILRRLTAGALTVSEIAEPLPMSLAGASKHIKVLERAGLIERRIEGRTHRCRLATERLAEARAWLDRYERFWTDSLDALERELRASAKTGDPPP